MTGPALPAWAGPAVLERAAAAPEWLLKLARFGLDRFRPAADPAVAASLTHLAEGRPKQAFLALAPLVEGDSGPDALAQVQALVPICLARLNLAGHAAAFAGLLAQNPGDAEAWADAAAARVLAGDLAGAAAHFAAAAARAPDLFFAKAGLAVIATLGQAWPPALALARDALALADRGRDGDGELAQILDYCLAAASFQRGGLPAPEGPFVAPDGAAPPNPGSGATPYAGTHSLIAFLACDPPFLRRYGMITVASLAATQGPGLAVHLHLYNADAEALALIDTLRARLPAITFYLTGERRDFPSLQAFKVYASSARFCRAAEAFSDCRAPMVILDADAMVRHDLAPLVPAAADVALCHSPRSPPWSRYPAGFVLLRPTAGARRFIDGVAAVVAANLDSPRPTWTLDQFALLFVADAGEGFTVERLPWHLVYDTTFSDDTLVWQASEWRREESNRYAVEARRLAAELGL